jgi:hypothetical protein
MNINVILVFALLILFTACGGNSARESSSSDKITIACYYFPNYHFDKRNTKLLGPGWSEWELTKKAEPRYPGHNQPRIPMWGYTDEANPVHMAQKIDAAANHGIDAFIFDWYYYDDGPFLEGGLEEGFMKAPNSHKIKFGLMWANHDWVNIFPIRIGLDKKVAPPVVYQGKITPETWDKMTDYIIEKYFKVPSYWKIDGAPYFSVYDFNKLLESFGSLNAAKAGLKLFRKKTRAAGFSDLHLNLVFWGNPVLPGEKVVKNADNISSRLGFNSITSYVWIHHTDKMDFPVASYGSVRSEYFSYAKKAVTRFNLPYFPNVTVGWDSSPRCDPNSSWGNYGYPYTSVIEGNTPDAFKNALVEAREFLKKNSSSKGILTLNSWNEWTEGSYLEPDTLNGMSYLQALKEVFGNKIIKEQSK